MANSSFHVTGLGAGDGSGFQIGDGVALTAGHIVFEAGGTKNNPRIRRTGFTIEDDYLGYETAYAGALAAFIANNNSFPSASQILTIESGLYTQDSVAIHHGGGVGSTGAGLFVALDTSAFLGFQGYLGTGASLQRDGQNTGRVSGNLLSATATTLTFSVLANTNSGLPGDSGGAYLIAADGREYVVGTQSSNNMTAGNAIGTRFTEADWYRLAGLVESTLQGNITASEPVNMAVGTAGADTLYGSGRSDILLGRDGNDNLSGGDTIVFSAAQIAAGVFAGGQVWADDQLYGGAGDDSFDAGMGRDLIHGGDRAATGVTVTAINADGVDSVDYSSLSDADADKGITIHMRDSATLPAKFQTYSAVTGFADAIFVEDLGRDQTVDTLISIEKIAGTAADDTLRIDNFSGSKLAGANGQGGLLEVNLGGQVNSTPEGDILDMSRSQEGGTFDWGSDQLLVTVSLPMTPDRKLVVKGAETLKATKAADTINAAVSNVTIKGAGGKDTITSTATGQLIYGDGGNDIIDATQGGADVYWLKGDGFDTVKTNYGGLNLNTLRVDTYEAILGNLANPRGVGSVNFTDLNLNEAELVLNNLQTIDHQVIGGVDYYLYTAQVWVLEQATGKGVNLGKAVASSTYLDLNQSDTYLGLWNLPDVVFADGNLSIGEGGANISFRVQAGNPPPEAPLMSSMSQPNDLSLAAMVSSFEFQDTGLAGRSRNLTLADQLDFSASPRWNAGGQFEAANRSAQLLAQALSVFGTSAGSDDSIFTRTHEQSREWNMLVDHR